MAKVTLFNGLTGLSTIVDAGGQGLRGKSWLDELSGFAHEAAEPANLAGIGLGRLANFSAIVDGQKMGTKPLGEDYSTPDFNGVDLFDVIRNSTVLATGDATEVLFGTQALTDPDRATANYYSAGGDPKLAVVPAGATSPAFMQSVVATLGDTGADTLSLVINGTQFDVVIPASTNTIVELLDALTLSGLPADIVGTPVVTPLAVRIFAPGNGVTSSIYALAGTFADSIFPGTGITSGTAIAGIKLGTNGPLGEMSLTDATAGGVKAQRRILPGSVIVTATLAAGGVTLTDDRAGVLSTLDDVQVGTIDYVTGAITLTFALAPTATAINAVWKVLVPKNLSSEVRLPEGSIGPVDGAPVVEMALILR